MTRSYTCEYCGIAKAIQFPSQTKRFCSRSCVNRARYAHRITDTVKRCARCEAVKPKKEFGKAKATLSGYGCYCKPCMGIMRQEWRDALPRLASASPKRVRLSITCLQCGISVEVFPSQRNRRFCTLSCAYGFRRYKPTIEGYRLCATCKQEKPRAEFVKSGCYCLKCASAKALIYHHANRIILNSKARDWRRAIKREVVSHYSNGTNDCECCHESHFEFLTIDHVNGDGAKHRKESPYTSLPVWLKKHGFPSGFRVLCFNCNLSRGFLGYCPHERSTLQSELAPERVEGSQWLQ